MFGLSVWVFVCLYLVNVINSHDPRKSKKIHTFKFLKPFKISKRPKIYSLTHHFGYLFFETVFFMAFYLFLPSTYL